MEVSIPKWLTYLAAPVLGGLYPEASATGLKAIGAAHEELAENLSSLSGDIATVSRDVLGSYSGPAADKFGEFMHSLAISVEPLPNAALQLGKLANDTGLNVETTKYMMLMQLLFTAEQVAELADTLWGLAAVPAVEAAARLTVAKLARKLLEAVAAGAISQAGINAAVQAIEILKGDKTGWSWSSFLTSFAEGAAAGAIDGLIHLGTDGLVPSLTHNILGDIAIGAVSGAVNGEVLNLSFGGDQDPPTISAILIFTCLMCPTTSGWTATTALRAWTTC
jgi:hypothetical protein